MSEFTYLLGKEIFDTLAAKSTTIVQGFLASLISLKGTFGFDPATGTPTFNIQPGDIKHPEYTLKEIFNYIEQCEKQIIITIDEFQHTVKNPMGSTFVRKYSLPSSSSVQSAILKLVKSGFITKTKRGYSLTDPLLRIFINDLYSASEI